MGVWAAAELARRADPLHAPVVLLEAASFEARLPASTTLLPGLVEDGPLRPALVDGARAVSQFELHTGRGIGFGRPGLLRLGSGSSTAEELRTPAFRLGLDAATLGRADWHPEAGLFDPARLQAEVLGLGRTHGLVTRPGVTALALSRTKDRIDGVETDRGPIAAERILITDPEVAARLLPESKLGVESCERHELRFASRLFEAPGAALGTIQGSTQELFDVGPNPEALEAFFGADEPLEYPHPALVSEDLEVLPDALACELVVVPRQGLWSPELRTKLARLAPVFTALGEPVSERRVRICCGPAGLPLVGELEPGLFVALGLGLREAQLAAGFAPGLAALMRGEPVAAFDPEALAPRATRRARS